jgi:hypothetical protein
MKQLQFLSLTFNMDVPLANRFDQIDQRTGVTTAADQ